jgi:hypothetical protein
MGGLYTAGLVTGLILSARAGDFEAEGFIFLFVFTVYMVVGALIVAQQPGNAIGWTFCATGLLLATGFVAMEYAAYAYMAADRPPPGALVAAWFANVYWYVLIATALILPILLFPSGLPSPRWRPVLWSVAGATAVITGLAALRPQLGVGADGEVVLDNPIGVAAVGDPERTGGFTLIVLVAATLAAVVSLGLRFRRAQGRERQQFKWFMYAAAVVLLCLAGGDLLPLPELFVVDVITSLSYGLLPAAVGLAILRHRLWDIDRLINRTVVYGPVTAVVLAAWALVALGLGSVVGQESSLAVAAATLAAAAVFTPLRKRVQRLVDRRFDRARYDAVQAVDGFSDRLRDSVDLGQLARDLVTTVDRTVQPATVDLWLAPSRRRTS